MWKQLKGDKDIYEISNYGNVRKMTRAGARGNIVAERQLKPHINSSGYYRVPIKINGQRKEHFIHRLVALLFVPNPLNKPYVNHKDGNKLNNHANNLEWCTPNENNIHAFRNGLKKPTALPGELHGGRIFNWNTINQIRIEYIKGDREHGQCALARKYNTSQSHIWCIVNYLNWKPDTL